MIIATEQGRNRQLFPGAPAGLLAAGMAIGFLLGAPAPAVAQRDALAAARVHYNAGEYDEAISAAVEVAALVPAVADSAGVVIGRSQIERFRRSADPADLDAARQALRSLNPDALTARERIEFVVGLGQALYYGETYGSAALVFESILDSMRGMGQAEHDRVLDWWATAVDRSTAGQGPAERAARYGPVVARMKEELERNPGSSAATYWLVAGTRGLGDLEGAWHAAVAGWVTAVLAPDRGAALRADLDRLVTEAILPELARQAGPNGTESTLERIDTWERIKQAWIKR